MVHTCLPSTQEAEAGGSQVPGQHEYRGPVTRKHHPPLPHKGKYKGYVYIIPLIQTGKTNLCQYNSKSQLTLEGGLGSKNIVLDHGFRGGFTL
jgi:hypothetical protein